MPHSRFFAFNEFMVLLGFLDSQYQMLSNKYA